MLHHGDRVLVYTNIYTYQSSNGTTDTCKLVIQSLATYNFFPFFFFFIIENSSC